jgi:hypothetical protein
MRARRRKTELTPHLTPIAVRTPRALSSSATACNFIAPMALISAMMGASSIACASAFTSRVWGPTRRFGQSRSLVVRRPTPLVLQCCVAFAENSLAAPYRRTTPSHRPRFSALSGRPIKNLISASRHCTFAYLNDFRPSAMQICGYGKPFSESPGDAWGFFRITHRWCAMPRSIVQRREGRRRQAGTEQCPCD